MKRMAALAAGALLAVLLAHADAAAQDTKTVRGTVTNLTAEAITVKVGDRDMTFKVDANTNVTVRGGSTATRSAKAEGKPGVPITSLVKSGQGVEVRYQEAGMRATNVRVLPAPPPPPAPAGQAAAGTAGRALSAMGVVTAVSNSSLNIKGSGGESTFAVDDKTKVIGTGVGTKAQAMKKAGEKIVITELLHTGDSVSVRYTEADGTKRASEVRITRRAKS